MKKRTIPAVRITSKCDGKLHTVRARREDIEVYTPEPQDRSGPRSGVTTPKYRDGWERTFGTKRGQA